MKFHGALLYIRDVERSIDYYHRKLGLPLLARPTDHVAIVGVGSSVILLHRDSDGMPEWMKSVLNHKYRGVGIIVHIEVDDVNALHRDLVARGVEISMGPVDQPFGQRQLYLYDPDGYNLVLQQPI